jgi:preprotein translocase subunit YajC
VDLGILILVAMFAVFWLLIIRPQRQQQRRHTELVDQLRPGDEIITAGGVYGDIIEVESDRVVLEIAEDVHIEVSKRAITSVVPPEEGDEFAAEEAEEAPEAREAEFEQAEEEKSRT